MQRLEFGVMIALGGAAQALPGAEVFAKYESLGPVGLLLVMLVAFLVAIFKDPPYLYPAGRVNAMLETRDEQLKAEQEKTRIALEAKADAERDAVNLVHGNERLMQLLLGNKSEPQRGEGP